MISRCGLMQKKDGMNMEEFQDYWLNVHGPIASNMIVSDSSGEDKTW